MVESCFKPLAGMETNKTPVCINQVQLFPLITSFFYAIYGCSQRRRAARLGTLGAQDETQELGRRAAWNIVAA